MNIDRSNYESWVLDYYEGTLSAVQVAELFLFLQQNPGCQAEFDAFKPLHISPPVLDVFDAKEALKRDVLSKHNIDYYLIREMENDLSLLERSRLNYFIKQNPEHEKTRELFRKTILPIVTEKFTAKKELKKKVIIPLYNQFNFWAAAAAIIILVLGIIYITRPGDENRMAEIITVQEDTINIHVNPKLSDKSSNKNIKNDVEGASDINSPGKRELPVAHNEKIIKHPGIEKFAQSIPNKIQRAVVHPSKNLPKRKEVAIEATHENLAMAEKKTYQSTNSNLSEVLPEKRNVESSTALITRPVIHRSSFDDKFNELKTATADMVNSITGEEILYSQHQNSSEASGHLPLKSRLIKLLAWSLNKISGDRVRMTTDFDQSGNLAAYEISAGKLKVERGF